MPLREFIRRPLQTFWDTYFGETWAHAVTAESAGAAARKFCEVAKTTKSDTTYRVTTCDEAGKIEHFDVKATVRISYDVDRIEGHDGD